MSLLLPVALPALALEHEHLGIAVVREHGRRNRRSRQVGAADAALAALRVPHHEDTVERNGVPVPGVELLEREALPGLGAVLLAAALEDCVHEVSARRNAGF